MYSKYQQCIDYRVNWLLDVHYSTPTGNRSFSTSLACTLLGLPEQLDARESDRV